MLSELLRMLACMYYCILGLLCLLSGFVVSFNGFHMARLQQCILVLVSIYRTCFAQKLSLMLK